MLFTYHILQQLFSYWNLRDLAQGRADSAENSSGLSRAELVQKFLRDGPTWAKNSSGPRRSRPIILPGRLELKILPGRADSPKNKFDVKWPPN